MNERHGALVIETRVRWHGKGITVDETSPLAKRWAIGTPVSFKWGSMGRREGVVFGWTRTKVVVGMDEHPFRYTASPHMLRRIRRKKAKLIQRGREDFHKEKG